MSKYTKFNQDCKEQFSWLLSVSNDIYSAKCELCRKTFSVKNLEYRKLNNTQQLKSTLKMSRR